MERHRLCRSMWRLLGLFSLLAAVLAPQPAVAQEGSCIDDVTGWTNACTAGDVQLVYFRNDTDTTCTPGEPVTLNLTAWLVCTALEERYDIGLFLALDGEDAGSGTCWHGYLPPPLASGGTCSGSGGACKKDADCPEGETCAGGYNPLSGAGPFYDAEPADAPDECGDLESDVDTYYRLDPVTVECVDADADGFLDIGTAVSWHAQNDSTCMTVADAIPSEAGVCRYWSADVVNVMLSPSLFQVQKTAQPEQVMEPGGWVTFTFVVENASPLAVTLEELVDSAYGPLEKAGGNCTLPQTLDPGGSYTCAIRAEVTGAPGIHQNLVTARGTDSSKNPVSYTTVAEVEIVEQPPDSGVGGSAAVVSGGMAVVGLALMLAGVVVRRKTA